MLLLLTLLVQSYVVKLLKELLLLILFCSIERTIAIDKRTLETIAIDIAIAKEPLETIAIAIDSQFHYWPTLTPDYVMSYMVG